MTEEQFLAVIRVNLGAAYELTSAAIPRFADGASVVSLASRAYLGNFGQFNYSASKGGLVGMTRALALQLAPNVRVNAIAPSLTASEMTSAMPEKVLDKMIASIPLGRQAEPRGDRGDDRRAGLAGDGVRDGSGGGRLRRPQPGSLKPERKPHGIHAHSGREDRRVGGRGHRRRRSRHRGGHRDRPARRRGGRRRRRPGRAQGLRGLVQDRRRGPREPAAQGDRADRARPQGPDAEPGPRAGQAGDRGGRRDPPPDPRPQLLRRPRDQGQGLLPRAAERAVEGLRHGDPPPDGRRRRDRPEQLPADAAGHQARARADGRQHDRGQARGHDAADDAQDRRPAARGRVPARRRQRDHRPRLRGGRRARHPRPRPPRRLHRLAPPSAATSWAWPRRS